MPLQRTSLQNAMRAFFDITYGTDTRQRFDVYAPHHAKNAPVIFMVHGGGWTRGDKTAQETVENRVARWVQRGFIFISTNYRMLPDTPPMEQAKDIAHAVATAQNQAKTWCGDHKKFILMGHSAGAHLVSLLSVSAPMTADLDIKPWLGTVSLDSAALDVVDQMQRPHAALYDRPFGRDPSYWSKVSPYHLLTKAVAPLFVVCSTHRSTSCKHAINFVAKTHSLGMHASLLPQNLLHKNINHRLGKDSIYTDAVEAFLFSLIK